MTWLSRLIFFASLVNLSSFSPKRIWKGIKVSEDYGKLDAEGQLLMNLLMGRRKRVWLLLQKQMLRKKLFNIPFKNKALWLSRMLELILQSTLFCWQFRVLHLRKGKGMI
ncbi:hypothetical protein ACB092_05G103000 [Castanea dentata]